MKASVIKEMTTEEVTDKLAEEHELFTKLRMGHTVSDLENPMVLKAKRKTIARLRTELKTRETEQSNK